MCFIVNKMNKAFNNITFKGLQIDLTCYLKL